MVISQNTRLRLAAKRPVPRVTVVLVFVALQLGRYGQYFFGRMCFFDVTGLSDDIVC